tara:strand:+ start:693 stop:1142 length:450 start_codon:yes stop_codon:yes gene_type:complete
MARTVITNILLVRPARVRIAKADGDCLFISGGKVYENGRYDGKWHTFPEGTRFDLIVAVDKTDTYMLLAKEKTVTVSKDEEGNEVKSTKTELIPVFLRRMGFNKIQDAAVDAEIEVAIDAEFGVPLNETEVLDIVSNEEVEAGLVQAAA